MRNVSYLFQPCAGCIASVPETLALTMMYNIVCVRNVLYLFQPCADCIAGVPEILPLTMMYNIPDMCEKCFVSISAMCRLYCQCTRDIGIDYDVQYSMCEKCFISISAMCRLFCWCTRIIAINYDVQ